MRKMLIIFFMGLALFGLASCTDPYERELPSDLDDSEALRAFQGKIDALPEQDKKDVASYVLRMKLGKSFGKAMGLEETDGIPPGMTVGKAIEEQRRFLEKERRKKDSGVPNGS
jgi:hypothetical protein